ncbi:DUF6515 family protein [Pelagicoccus mobilis]
MIRFSTKLLAAVLIVSSPLAPIAVPEADAKASLQVGTIIGYQLPASAVTIKVGNTRYHTHKGVYYRKTTHGYKVVKAPRGAIIRRLPLGYKRVVLRGKTYFRVRDVYYIKASKGYKVVIPT